MHIAFFSPSWPPGGVANGVVTYVDAMSEELRRLGHEVSVITPDGIFDGPSQERRPIPAGPLDRWRRQFDRLRKETGFAAGKIKRAFADLHRHHPIDIIEMEETFGWFGEVAKLGIPLVVRLHGPCFRAPIWVDSSRRTRWLRNRERRERHALEAARAISSPARLTLEETNAAYRIAAPIQEVRVNPVRVASPEESWSAQACDPHSLLWVGQFTYAKGADILLGAFSQLVDQWPDLRLDIVGPDTGIDVEGQRYRFDDYCAKFLEPGVLERVRMHGLLKPAEIRPMRARAGLTLITSRSEVFPYILAEAMASASPVVSTRWGGEQEIIRHGESGWIARDNSPDAVAALLREVLSAPMTAREICSQGGLAFCKGNLSQAAVVEQALPVYQAAIDAGKSANR